ncbi:MAG TPA: hypothetical protein VGZ26_07100, partial [Pirellulales bacterium]|nr:hypothetical protein [Pirellulales bacterium]
MGIGHIMLLCVAAYVVLRIGRRVAFGKSSSSIRPLTVLGVAAIIGGLAVFGGRGASHVIHVRSDRWSPVDEHLIDDEVSASVPSQSFWQSEPERTSAFGHDLKWVLICLGSVLVISGALLAGRGRARPVALKALTVLGLAAATYALVTFVSSVPRHTWYNQVDRIVKNNREITIGDDSSRDEATAPATPPKKPKRAHAKRPASRPERRDSIEELIAKIPPRAGEIPVADELANTAAKIESAGESGTSPSPAAAEGVSIPTPEPSQLTEPAAVAKTPEQPKPADQSPAQTAATTPQAADAPEPVTDSTPATTPAASVHL